MTELEIIGSSILDIAQVGVHLSQKFYAVGSSAALPAPHNIHRVATNVTLFAGLLKHVAIVLEGNGKLLSREGEGFVGNLVGQCEVLFEEIEGMLGGGGGGEEEEDKAVGKSKRRVSMLRRIKWRFEQPRVDWLMAQLEYLQTTLSLLIQTVNLATVTARIKKTDVNELVDAGRRKEDDRMGQERVHVEALVVARQLSMIALRQFDEDEDEENEEAEGQSDDSERTNRPKLLKQGSTYDSTLMLKRNMAKKDVLDDFSNGNDTLFSMTRHSHAVVDTLLSRWTVLPPPYTEPGDGSPVEKIEEALSKQTKTLANVGPRLTESALSTSRSDNNTSTPPPPQNTKESRSKRSSLGVNNKTTLGRTTSTPEPSSVPSLHINSYATRVLDPSLTWHQPQPYMPVEMPLPDYTLPRSISRASQNEPRSLTLPAPTPRPGYPSVASPDSTISRHSQNRLHHSRTAPTPLSPNSNYQAPFISDWESTVSSSRSSSPSTSRSSSPSTPGTNRHRRRSQGLEIPWRIRVFSSSAGIASGRYFDFIDSSLVGPRTPFLPPTEALARIYSDPGLRATAKEPGAVTEIETAWVAEKSLRVANWRYIQFWGARAEPPAPLDGGYRDDREGEQGWRIQGALTVDDIEALVEHTIELHKEGQQQSQARQEPSKRNPRSERDSGASSSNRPQNQSQQRPTTSYTHRPQKQNQQPSRHRSVSFSNNTNPPPSQQQQQQQPPPPNQHYSFSPMVQSPSLMGGPQAVISPPPPPQNYRQSMYGGNNPQNQNPYFPMQGPGPGPGPGAQQQQQQQYSSQQNLGGQMPPYPPGPNPAQMQAQQQTWNYAAQQQQQQQRINNNNNDARDRERSYSPSPERRRHRSRKERREKEEERERREEKKKKNSAAGTIARLGGLAALLEGFDAL